MRPFLCILIFSFFLTDLPGFFPASSVSTQFFLDFSSPYAQAATKKKRYKQQSGKKAPGCKDFPRPALCSGIKAKTDIYVVSEICETLKAKPACFATIGYRSCRTNSKIRGAARRSAHLCGKAVDIRLNTCKLGDFHGKGSAKHRHHEIGKCY